jgi:tellurite resistance protein TerC
MMFAEDKEVDPESNAMIRQFRRLVPVTPEMHGNKFFLKIDGKLHATPLFVALLFLELTDIVFAVDSVPAIFALTREPLIVFTSNIFAILGLRNLYFLLRGALDKLYGGHFPITYSLGIIVGVIGISVVLSLMFPRKDGGKAGHGHGDDGDGNDRQG